MFKNMGLVILFDMFLNPSFKMTTSFANIARTAASYLCYCFISLQTSSIKPFFSSIVFIISTVIIGIFYCLNYTSLLLHLIITPCNRFYIKKLFVARETTCDQNFSVSDMSQIYIFYHMLNRNIILRIRMTQRH